MSKIKDRLARMKAEQALEAKSRHASEICDLCCNADASHLMVGFIEKNTPVATVKTELSRLTGLRRVAGAAAARDRTIDPRLGDQWFAEGLSVPEARERVKAMGPGVPRAALPGTAAAGAGNYGWDAVTAKVAAERGCVTAPAGGGSGASAPAVAAMTAKEAPEREPRSQAEISASWDKAVAKVAADRPREA